MKKVLTVTLIFFGLSAQSQSIEEILESHRLAAGFQYVNESYSFQVTEQLREYQLDQKLEITLSNKNKLYVQREINEIHSELIIKDGKGWIKDQNADSFVETNQFSIDKIINEINFEGVLLLYLDLGYKLELDSLNNSEDEIIIRCFEGDELISTVILDSNTFLISREERELEVNGQIVNLKIETKQYLEVEQHKVPSYFVYTINGKVQKYKKLSNIQFNPEIDESIFNQVQ